MTVAELLAAKAELEMQISEAVASYVKLFHERTGLYPASIQVPMVDVTSFSSVERERIVGQARVEILL